MPENNTNGTPGSFSVACRFMAVSAKPESPARLGNYYFSRLCKGKPRHPNRFLTNKGQNLAHRYCCSANPDFVVSVV